MITFGQRTGFDSLAMTSGTGLAVNGISFGAGAGDFQLYRETSSVLKVNAGFTVSGAFVAAAGFAHLGTTAGLYGKAAVVQASAIAAPTAPSVGYVQAEAASMKTAVDAIRTALTGIGITA